MAEKRASISVDLDSIPHYCRIHGLDEGSLPARAATAVYQVAIERFVDLFRELGVAATFFAVGQDLVDPASASALAGAAGAGHEIGNHSFSHPYALTRLGPEELVREIAEGEDAIAKAVGIAPRGFRAPGYTMTAPLLRALAARGYLYDSSVFPAAPYYLAKAAIMGVLSAAGRPSRAILDRPRVLLAPTQPYRPDPGEPYRPGRAPIVELPIAVEPVTRVPLIGTSAVLFPEAVTRGIYRSLRRQPFLNFELHGIDLLDAGDVDVPALARRQRELRVPWAEKRERLRRVLGWIATDYRITTLEAAARELAV